MTEAAADIDLDTPEIRDRWPQELATQISIMERAFAEVGESADRARALAIAGVRAVAQYQGGRMFYLPRGDRLERALRDREIWERFNGRNQRSLSREYRLTDKQIYAILREQRALARRRNTFPLFPED